MNGNQRGIRQGRLAAQAAAAAAAATALLLGGCGSTNVVTVTDRSAPTANLRGTYRLNESGGGAGLELSASTSRAKGTQDLGEFAGVTVGGQSFSGPVRLQHDARMSEGHLVYNHLLFADRPVQLEWFAGFAGVRVRWATSAPGTPPPQGSQSEGWSGLTGGILGRVKLGPQWALEGRVQGIADGTRVVGNTATLEEAALVFLPTPQLRLRGGWSWHSADLERAFTSNSWMYYRASGPFLSLAFEFR